MGEKYLLSILKIISQFKNRNKSTMTGDEALMYQAICQLVTIDAQCRAESLRVTLRQLEEEGLNDDDIPSKGENTV